MGAKSDCEELYSLSGINNGHEAQNEWPCAMPASTQTDGSPPPASPFRLIFSEAYAYQKNPAVPVSSPDH